jgi:HemY protein
MKSLITILVLVAIGVWLGIAVHNDSGYVLVAYQHVSIESSIWVALCALIITFILLYLLIRFISGTLHLSNRFRLWSGGNRLRKSQKLTQDGLCALAEGRWKKAQDILKKAAHDCPTPLINYLAAARAAQELHDYNGRDAFLKKAADSTKGAELAVGLTQAQLQMAAKQWEQALASLRHLNDLQPNHPFTLKLLNVVYLKLEDFNQLELLLPTLKKQKILHDKKYQKLAHLVYKKRLTHATTSSLADVWQSTPKALRTDTTIVLAYTQKLIACGDSEKALTQIDLILKKQWSPELIATLADITVLDYSKSLLLCEGFLKQHPRDAQLLLSLGSICAKMKLWGKAKDYLLMSIELCHPSKAYLILGEVYEALDNKAEAIKAYKQGLLAPPAG